MTRSAKTRTNNRTKTCRRGITLLEVLISMFVALVGLSGLAALFWLGGIEMSEGAKLDRAISVGRSALRSLKIYGLLRPIQTYTSTVGGVTTSTQVQTWLTPAGATVDGSGTNGMTTTQPVMPFSTTSYGTVTPLPNVAYGNYLQGFAIDPIGVITNHGHSDSAGDLVSFAFPGIDATGSTPAAITYAPAQSTSAQSIPTQPLPCLSRITLQAYPQNTTAITYPQSPSGPNPIHAMTSGQADLIFRSGDDLLLNPPNGDFPPTQYFSTLQTPGGPVPARRQSQGDYSWMATVVPSFSDYEANTSGATPVITPLGDTNQVRVSIVVFYKRIPLITLETTNLTSPPSERMVIVNLNPIGPNGIATGVAPTGVAGGDIQLQCAQPSYLNLKAGQWIMLSQNNSGSQTFTGMGSSLTAKNNYWYRWYKVVATGAVQGPTGGTYNRNVTLSGPDWNTNLSGAAYASIVDGVVAVYEKEIELEPSGAPLAPN